MTQWFSVPAYSPRLERAVGEDEARALVAKPPLEVLRVFKSSTKLRRNQHAGNRFEVVVSGVADVEACRATLAALRTTGCPNYYGPQRFGGKCGTAVRGARLVARLRASRGPQRRRLKRQLRSGFAEAFAVAALNSMLFNVYVADRVDRGAFARWLEGDVPTRRDLVAGPAKAALENEGGPDVDDDVALARGDVSYTGPLFGKGLFTPDAGSPAAALEAEVLRRSNVDRDTVDLVADGARRAACLPCADVALAPHDAGVVFRFALPRGAYATSLLREFTKAPNTRESVVDDDDDDDGRDDDDDAAPPPPSRDVDPRRASRFAASAKDAGKGRRLEKWLLHRTKEDADAAVRSGDHGHARLQLRLRVNDEVRRSLRAVV